MKVRILSGNYAGCVEDVEQLAGESMLSTGYAELVEEPKKRAGKTKPKEEPVTASHAESERYQDDESSEKPAHPAHVEHQTHAKQTGHTRTIGKKR